jgi:polysaccharide pyruvyl transferase WcaK-like protein
MVNKLPAKAATRVGLFGILGSGNSGNDASMETVLAFLREAHPDAVVNAMGGGSSEMMRARYGIGATPLYWYMKYEGRVSGPSAVPLKALGKGLDVLRTMSWVRRQDVIMVPGAGPLEFTLPVRAWGFPFTLFLVALSGKLFGTKVALVSVGAAGIKKPFTRWLSNSTVRLCAYRSYRDAYSLEAIKQRGIDTSRDHVYPDLVFGAPVPSYDPGDPNVVGVGVMAYYGSNDDDRQRAAEIHSAYVEKMTRFTGWLVDHGHDVRLFGGDSKFDWDVADRIMADVRRERPDLSPSALSVKRANSYAELMQLMAPAGMVVATRYHNVMCALKLCKPTISLGYSQKFVTLMGDMGLAEFNQFTDSFSVEKLLEQFEDLKKRRTELRQLMVDRNAANNRALDEQFAVLSRTLFGKDAPARQGASALGTAGRDAPAAHSRQGTTK